MIALPRAYRRALLAALVVGATITLLGFSISRLQQPDLRALGGEAPAQPVPSGAADEGDAAERLYHAGIAALRRGDAPAAALAFEEAAKLRPDVAAIQANLGFAYLEMDHPQAARDRFWQALTLDSRQINAFYGLGEAYEALDDLVAASDAMRRFIDRSAEDDPFRGRARERLATWSRLLAQGQGRPDSGASAAERRNRTALDRPAETTGAEAGAEAGALAGAEAGATSDAAAADSAPVQIAIGEQVADLTLTALDGHSSDFARYAGKTVILNVWATWCPPCRVELPSLERLHRSLAPERFAVVGLSVDEDAEFLAEFIHEQGLSYENFVDAPRRITQGRFGVYELPQTLLIDPSGRLIERIVGIRDWSASDMRARLEEIDRAGREGET